MSYVYTGTLKIHIKVKFKGSPSKISLLNKVVRDLDRDWPFNRSKTMPARECPKCGGYVWEMPRLDLGDLKNLIRQIHESKLLPGHLIVKIKQYRTEDVCESSK